MYLSTTPNEISYAHYQHINNLATERIEDILTNIGVAYHKNGKKLSGSCPVHGGDNFNAWHVYTEGHITKGNWACYTHNCHEKGNYGRNFIGLIRGIISFQTGRKVSTNEALTYLCDFLKIDIYSIEIDYELLEKMQFVTQNQEIEQKPNLLKYKRLDIRKKLIIPSDYYIKRNYSAKILNKFDVGRFQFPNDKMKNRVIVPVYDDNSNFIGCLGRSIFNQCKLCNLYHDSAVCPSTLEEKLYAAKWVNSTDFQRNKCLYNYWNAREYIKRTGVAVIVEGPGDVWRLEEAGIRNSVALFGVAMGDDQRRILEKSGAFTLIVLTDNDKAGKTSKVTIKEACGRLFTLVFPEIEQKDIGDTPVQIVKDDLKPYIESFNI